MNLKTNIRRRLARLSVVCLVLLICSLQVQAAKWSFGVIADTQWSGTDPTGNNINSVAVNQIKACNQAFVNAHVDFVVQVGDLCNDGTTAALQTRLDANSALNTAAIPFYGLRGNHDDNSTAKTFFQSNYLPTSKPGATVAVASDGISYSVTHNNTKVVLLDILTEDSTTAMDAVTPWVASQVKASDHTQSFVFSHKTMLGQANKDNQFGGSNDANPTQQNNFMKALQDGGTRYVISGHDHLYHRSEVTSPDGTAKVEEIISGSDSSGYFTPGAPFSTREQPFAQQLRKTGYTIYSVDGPRVTGQYFGSTPLANGDVDPNTPFALLETFGYSTNGKQFIVASGGSLSAVQDTYGTTTMRLSGTNTSTVKTSDGRLVNKDINTGWTDKLAGFASDALTLWGVADVGSATSSFSFTLTMSYGGGDVYIARQNADGTWTRLTSTVNGDGTVSALVNSGGTYAVASVPEPGGVAVLGVGLISAAGLTRKRHK